MTRRPVRWRRQTISIAIPILGVVTWREVSASVCRGLAVHSAEEDLWRVTHAPSGCGIGPALPRRRAFAFARGVLPLTDWTRSAEALCADHARLQPRIEKVRQRVMGEAARS